RHAQRPSLVPEVSFDDAGDGRGGEAREPASALGVEAVDGVQEAFTGELDEVVGLDATPLEPERQLAGHGLEAQEQLVAGGAVREQGEQLLLVLRSDTVRTRAGATGLSGGFR